MADVPPVSRHARPTQPSAAGDDRELTPGGPSPRDAPPDAVVASTARESRRGRRPISVTAILVAHNGARWLPDVFAALRRATRQPDRVVGVDTGSRDDSAALLQAAWGPDSVVSLERGTGFGSAVKAALAHLDGSAEDSVDAGEQEEWLWLLHDDCTPEPTALQALVDVAASAPRSSRPIAAVGPKVLGWTDRRVLVELGLTISRSGRRHTGLEPGEEDQGQHDDRQRVLAVGSAGMLVRRSAWVELGGFDPQLPLFRDDVDFGWRANLAGYEMRVAPAAALHHVQAASTGRRTIDAGPRRRHLADRRNALFVLLANLPASQLPLAYVRLVLGSLLRAVGFALGKLPGAAIDELTAIVIVIARPDRVLSARRSRRDLQTSGGDAPRPNVMSLLAPRSAQLQRGLDALAGLFDRGHHGAADLSARGHRAAETGSVDEDAESLETDGVAWLRWVRRPGTLLILGALVVALAADRALLGGGRLMDGALLPAPTGAADLWASYASAWHDVGLGSAAVAPAYLAPLALLATVLLGKAPLAVDLLLLGAVPLCAVTAYVSLRRLLTNPRVRVWAAATYALLPATSGAIAGGRLGTVVALILGPLLAVALAAAAGWSGRPASWPATWAAALTLAVMTAFVPLSYVAVAALVVLGCARARSWAFVVRAVTVLAVVPLLLLPWSAEFWHHPGLLLLEAGLPGPGLSDAELPPLSVLLQASGGPGAIPWWLGIPLLLGGLAALLGSKRRGVVLSAWVVVIIGVALGVGTSLATVSTATTENPVAAWPGLATAMVAAGLLVACAVAAEWVRERLAASSFGWRQPVAVAVTFVVAASPALLAGWWIVRGADGPLDRRDPVVLPEFVAASGVEPARPRTVVLRSSADGSLTYALLRDEGPRIGDAETGPPLATYATLDNAVADLVSGRGGELAGVLAQHAVQYLLVAAPVDPELVATLDSVPTLQRLATTDGAALWQLSLPASRLRLDDAEGTTLRSLPAGAEDAHASIPAGASGRRVVLAERADPRWTATLDGAPLSGRVVDGWAQAWTVPPAGGQLAIEYDGSDRHRWLLLEGAVTVIVVLLSLPSARRRMAGDG